MEIYTGNDLLFCNLCTCLFYNKSLKNTKAHLNKVRFKNFKQLADKCCLTDLQTPHLLRFS